MTKPTPPPPWDAPLPTTCGCGKDRKCTNHRVAELPHRREGYTPVVERDVKPEASDGSDKCREGGKHDWQHWQCSCGEVEDIHCVKCFVMEGDIEAGRHRDEARERNAQNDKLRLRVAGLEEIVERMEAAAANPCDPCDGRGTDSCRVCAYATVGAR